MDYNRPSTQGSGSSAGGSSVARAQVSKNTRRLQLRNNNIRAASFSNDIQPISNPKTRNKGRPVSSDSSNFSGFEDDLTFHSQSTCQNENSPPKTPSFEADTYWVSPSSKKRNFVSDNYSTVSSIYSGASTLVDGQIEGFGSLYELEGNSVVGFRFYDSGSGSERPFSGCGPKKEMSNGSTTSDGSPRKRGSGRRRTSGAKNGYTTPPKRSFIGKKQRDEASGPFSHPDDNARHLEYVEQQLKELTEKYNEITSPTSTASHVARLKKLTAENKALRLEVEEYHTVFEEKVKEASRQKIIENERETRARIATAEERIRQNEETIKKLRAEVEKWKADFYELAEAAYEEKQKYDQNTQAYEAEIESLKQLLESQLENNSGDTDSRPTSMGKRRRSLFINGQTLMDELGISESLNASSRRGSICSDYSDRARDMLQADAYPDAAVFSDPEELVLPDSPLARYSKPNLPIAPTVSTEIGDGDNIRNRRMRKFNVGTAAPMPLILPATLGMGPTVQSPVAPKIEVREPTPTAGVGFNGGSNKTQSRPLSCNSFYGAGAEANDSTTSIDSSVHSTLSSVPRSVRVDPLTKSLFAELHLLGDEGEEHERLVAPEDTAAFSRAQSPVPTYSTAFALAGALSDTGARVVRKASSVFSPSRRTSSVISSQGSLTTAARTAVGSNIVGSMFPSPQMSLFTTFKSNILGTVLVHGFRTPAFVFQAAKKKAINMVSAVLRERGYIEKQSRRGRKDREREAYVCTCGAKKSKAMRRSASAPTSGRMVEINLLESTGGQLCGQMDQTPPRRVRKRRNSNTWHNSESQRYRNVTRTRQVHAGDNVWTWVKFVFTLIVALGVACKEGSLGDIVDGRVSGGFIVSDYGIDCSSSDSDDTEDDRTSADDDSLEGKVERWRRQWNSSALIGGV